MNTEECGVGVRIAQPLGMEVAMRFGEKPKTEAELFKWTDYAVRGLRDAHDAEGGLTPAERLYYDSILVSSAFLSLPAEESERYTPYPEENGGAEASGGVDEVDGPEQPSTAEHEAHNPGQGESGHPGEGRPAS